MALWQVVMTDVARRWVLSLSDDEQTSMSMAIDALRQSGPLLGRPLADRIKTSRHHNMKELRVPGGHLRVLYAFDPRRTAIVLLGGDKSGDWSGWYTRNVPRADALYDEYLRTIDEGGQTR